VTSTLSGDYLGSTGGDDGGLDGGLDGGERREHSPLVPDLAVPHRLERAGSRGRGPRPRRRGASPKRLAVVGVVLIVAIGFLLYKGLSSAIVYFETASEAVAHRAELANSTFQIEGVVVPGSLHRVGPDTIDFTISSGRVPVPVVNTGDPPQLFGPDVPVVLVGHFIGSSDSFASNQVLVKHSNQYIAAHPNRVRAPTHAGAGTS